MSTPNDGIIPTEVIERQLDRIQSFVPRVDARVSAYIAILSAQIAVVAINLSIGDFKTLWMVFMVVFYLGCSAWAFLNLFMCTHPTLDGREQSLIYFGEIIKIDQSVYCNKLISLKEDELREDLAKQIYRNSQIVDQKYSHLSRAGTGLLVGMIPWTLVLIGSSITNGTIPTLSN